MMQMAEPHCIEKEVDTGRLHAIMAPGRKPEWPDLPVEIISTGLPDIIMPVKNLEELNLLCPDMDALTEMSRELNVVGVHAVAVPDDGYTGHVRNFAPLYDISEEAATGTANAALTHYLFRQRVISCPAECHFLQGEAMHRPSVVATKIEQNGIIWVGGQSCIIAQGDLLIG